MLTGAGIELAGSWAEKPNTAVERIVDKHGELRDLFQIIKIES